MTIHLYIKCLLIAAIIPMILTNCTHKIDNLRFTKPVDTSLSVKRVPIENPAIMAIQQQQIAEFCQKPPFCKNTITQFENTGYTIQKNNLPYGARQNQQLPANNPLPTRTVPQL